MSFIDRVRNHFSDSENNDIWNKASELGDVETILQKSNEKPQLIYKHSHRCSVCFLAKEELEGVADEINDIADLYMVNVIHERDLSNRIASELNVRHESPQVIIVKDREVRWKGSHWEVKGDEIWKSIRNHCNVNE
ncbi:MAG: bacillithiol system redox-active protein YtxJ [Balneolaceae bacterium]|nr:bacillithiol system redox-active protein YtxJ [Balneolaceae bacterium]